MEGNCILLTTFCCFTSNFYQDDSSAEQPAGTDGPRRVVGGPPKSEKRSEAGGIKLEEEFKAGGIKSEQQSETVSTILASLREAGIAPRRRRHTSRQASYSLPQHGESSAGNSRLQISIRGRANRSRPFTSTPSLPNDMGRVRDLPAYRQPASGEYLPNASVPTRPAKMGYKHPFNLYTESDRR
jgi:hypothetical protein